MSWLKKNWVAIVLYSFFGSIFIGLTIFVVNEFFSASSSQIIGLAIAGMVLFLYFWQVFLHNPKK